MSTHHIRASRRRFPQFVASSPLFARTAQAGGLGAFGQAGIERVLGILRFETRNAMQQFGAPTLKDITPEMVRRV